MAATGPRRRPGCPRTGDLRKISYGGRGINPCHPTGIFHIRGSRMSQNRSTCVLERNSSIPAVFLKTSRTSVNSTGIANCYDPLLPCYAQNILYTSELIMCVTTTQWGYGCRGNRGYQDGRSLDSESDGRNIAILFLKTRESTGIYGNRKPGYSLR